MKYKLVMQIADRYDARITLRKLGFNQAVANSLLDGIARIEGDRETICKLNEELRGAGAYFMAETQHPTYKITLITKPEFVIEKVQ